MIDELERYHGDIIQCTDEELNSRKKVDQSRNEKSVEKERRSNVKASPFRSEIKKEQKAYLQSELDSLKAKYELILEENNILASQKQDYTSDEISTSQNLKELNVKIGKLKSENIKLAHMLKKSDKKCAEQKKNLKQLFNLITDKEKEVNYLKSQMKGNSINNEQNDNLILEALQDKIVEINEDLKDVCDLFKILATQDKGHLVHTYYFFLS